MKLFDWIGDYQRRKLGADKTIEMADRRTEFVRSIVDESVSTSRRTIERLYETGHPIGDVIERRIPHGHPGGL